MVNPKIPDDPVDINITHVSVTVAKTVQPRQYEPVRIEVTQTAEIGDMKASVVRRELYERTSRAVSTMMREELKRWSEE